jgi:hypothetical protein
MKYLAMLSLIPAICQADMNSQEMISFCEYRITQIEHMKEGMPFYDSVRYFLEGEEMAFNEMKNIIEMNQLVQ